MNEVMPQWRTFASGQPEVAPPNGARPPGGGLPPRGALPVGDPVRPGAGAARAATGPRTLLAAPVLALVGVGGTAAGAGLVALALVLLGLSPTVVIPGLAGDPGIVIEGAGEPLDGRSLDASLPGPGALTSEGDAAAAPIVVDVAGAVARPGLQRLSAGARVGDAIEAAGGYAPRVDLAEAARSLNLAQPLADGAKVLVPALGIAQPQGGDAASDGRIDLNAADQALLETLPGVGPVTAGKIVAARSEAPFASVAELRDRGLVGDAVFEDIRELVRVGR